MGFSGAQGVLMFLGVLRDALSSSVNSLCHLSKGADRYNARLQTIRQLTDVCIVWRFPLTSLTQPTLHRCEQTVSNLGRKFKRVSIPPLVRDGNQRQHNWHFNQYTHNGCERGA